MTVKKSLEGAFKPVPREILIFEIAPYLNEKEIENLGFVNKLFRSIFYSDHVWKIYINKNISIKFLGKYFEVKTSKNFKYKKIITVFYKNFYRYFCHYFQENYKYSFESKKDQNIFDKKLELDKLIKKHSLSSSCSNLNKIIDIDNDDLDRDIKKKKFSIYDNILMFLQIGVCPNKDTLKLLLKNQKDLSIDRFKEIFNIFIKSGAKLDENIINYAFLWCEKNVSIEILKFLIKKKVKPDKDTLNLALSYHKNITIEMLKFLIKNGAKPNKDTLDNVLRDWKSIEIIKFLIENGARPTKDTLLIAIVQKMSKDLIEFLIKNGAKLEKNTLDEARKENMLINVSGDMLKFIKSISKDSMIDF